MNYYVPCMPDITIKNINIEKKRPNQNLFEQYSHFFHIYCTTCSVVDDAPEGGTEQQNRTAAVCHKSRNYS